MHLASVSIGLAFGLSVFAIATASHAQTAPAVAPPVSRPAPPAPVAAAPPSATACIPSCRSGYVCIDAKCIQACNPPCPDGQICTADAQCIAAAPPVVVPVPPGPPAAPYPQWSVSAPLAPGGPEVSKGIRFHDGFYLRMALGVGALSATYRNDLAASTSEGASGVALMDELAFGGTPSPGVVIGGGIYGSTTPSPSTHIDGNKVKMGAIGAGVIAPFVDVYPNPTGGFHVQGAFGVAVLSAAQGNGKHSCVITSLGTTCTDGGKVPPDEYGGAGLGIVAGIGYEGWIGEQWSIGGLARITYFSGTMHALNDDSLRDVKVHGVVPGVLLSLTYH